MVVRPGLSVLVATLLSSVAQGQPASGTEGPGPYVGPSDEALPPDAQRFAATSHHQCGKYALVFRNPDLREDTSDYVHAQGQFFIQFQVVGKGSSEVKKLSFSFGLTHDLLMSNPAVNCNAAVPETQVGRGTGGAYLYYYRSDFEAKDGFFVPIQTRNVPDGEYAASLHAYNGAGAEVARSWTRAKVDNCPSEPTVPNDCPNDEDADILRQDRTKPWPIVLPGDGEQTNGVNGLTIEFGEEVDDKSVEVSLNTRPVNLTQWQSPERDDDLQPNNDAQPCPQNLPIVCTRKRYGPGFKWEGEVRVGDIVRVRAKDLNGNLAEKIVQYGADFSKGTVEVERPEVVMLPLNGQEVSIRPEDGHEFNLRLDNIGVHEATVRLRINQTAMPDWSVNWTDGNGTRLDLVRVPAGGQVVLKLAVVTTAATAETHYYFQPVAEYDVAGVPTQKSIAYLVDVNRDASPDHHHAHQLGFDSGVPEATNETTTAAPRADTPAPGIWSVAGAALAVFVWLDGHRRPRAGR